MSGTSTINAFEQALQANLKKRTGLSGVTITVGPPTAGELMVGEWLMLGNSTATQNYATFPYNAPTSRDETARIELLINVVQAINADHTVVNNRAYALLAEVENELRSNPSQGVTNVLWAEIAPSMRVQKQMNPDAGWRETLITSQIKLRSRI